jgi:glycosyltransferase involved in cell wall biosynthesis
MTPLSGSPPPRLEASPPRISVVIPTFQRRDLVVSTVAALSRQDFDGSFEVVVVVDGSTDGTADALRALRVPFPLTVLEQANGGMPTARSAGGYAARGEILLFMDDDMEADPRLLAEHDRSHRGGAGIVLGPNPLHPESPPNLLSRWVSEWVDGRTAKLSAPGSAVPVKEIWGRYSVSRESFLAVRGFDARLRRGSDVDFAYRVLLRGHRAEFNPNAISRQKYIVTPRQYLLQWRRSGQSDVTSARKQPEIASQILFPSWTRWPFRLLARTPILTSPLRAAAVALVERGHQGALTNRLFFWAQAVEYCRGLHEAGGMPRRRPLRVLVYRPVQEASADSLQKPQGDPCGHFRQHLATLLQAGYHFVSPHEVLHFVLDRSGLPRRPVLLTFESCSTSMVELLEGSRVPALAFVVTQRIAASNDRDRQLGAHELMLDIESIRRLQNAGVEIATRVQSVAEPPESRAVRQGDASGRFGPELDMVGPGPIRFFADASGGADAGVRRAVEAVGGQIIFGVEPGLVHPGAGPHQLPRIDIRPGDSGWRLRWKVAVAGPLLSPGRGWAAFGGAVWERWGRPLLRGALRSAVPVPARRWVLRLVRR